MRSKNSYRIGVLSDTHNRTLPEEMLFDFQDVDFIIHAGDFCEVEVLNALKKIKPVHAVCGNMDSTQIAALLPKQEIISCGPYRIGLIHGEGPPQGIIEKVRERFKGQKVDVVIFGHSHAPFNQMNNGVLYFNPGSPTDDVYAPYLSYGILDLSECGVGGRIVKLKNHHG